MSESINEILKLDEATFNQLPSVVKLMQNKKEPTLIVRLVFCKSTSSDILINAYYKPISKMHSDAK